MTWSETTGEEPTIKKSHLSDDYFWQSQGIKHCNLGKRLQTGFWAG